MCVISLSSPGVHWFRLRRKYTDKTVCSVYKILVQTPCFCLGFVHLLVHWAKSEGDDSILEVYT